MIAIIELPDDLNALGNPIEDSNELIRMLGPQEVLVLFEQLLLLFNELILSTKVLIILQNIDSLTQILQFSEELLVSADLHLQLRVFISLLSLNGFDLGL